MSRRPARGLAFWVASGVSGLLALTVLDVVADKAGASGPLAGVAQWRDYLIRRNG